MSLRYLPGHAEKALLALELARKESAHMQHTHRTLFALPIDAACSLATMAWAGYARFPKTSTGFADVLQAQSPCSPTPRFAPPTFHEPGDTPHVDQPVARAD